VIFKLMKKVVKTVIEQWFDLWFCENHRRTVVRFVIFKLMKTVI